jgi:hypothetical protein
MSKMHTGHRNPGKRLPKLGRRQRPGLYSLQRGDKCIIDIVTKTERERGNRKWSSTEFTI